MGFDLYGLKPYNPHNAEKPIQLNWALDHTEEEKKAYFEAVDAYETVVIGSYFRNNVWWWRPLWMFISMECDDILTEEDLSQGCNNGGHTICKTKAKKIASRIRRLDKEGEVDRFQKIHDERRVQANNHNKKVRKELDALRDKVNKELGRDVVPADYPEPYRTQWDDIYSKEQWAGHYPFNADNVREFGKFCDNSGGFEIC